LHHLLHRSILTAAPQSLAKILVHTVISTKDRRPFLRNAALRQELHHYRRGILKRLDSQPVIISEWRERTLTEPGARIVSQL
jgi:hypothetical protein